MRSLAKLLCLVTLIGTHCASALPSLLQWGNSTDIQEITAQDIDGGGSNATSLENTIPSNFRISFQVTGDVLDEREAWYALYRGIMPSTVDGYRDPVGNIDLGLGGVRISIKRSTAPNRPEMLNCHVIWAVQRLAERLYRNRDYHEVEGIFHAAVSGTSTLTEIGIIGLKKNTGPSEIQANGTSISRYGNSSQTVHATSRRDVDSLSIENLDFYARRVHDWHTPMTVRDVHYTVVGAAARISERTLFSQSWVYENTETGIKFFYLKTSRRSIIMPKRQMGTVLAGFYSDWEDLRQFCALKSDLFLRPTDLNFGTVGFTYHAPR